MPVGQKDHQRITIAVAVGLGGLDQLVDLVVLEILARPQLSVFQPTWRNCSIFSGWRDGARVRFS
jgi:hypothetical protein